MRQGQHKNRSRGRSGGGQRRPGGGNSANRVFESNGPDVKVRGTAQTVADKYLQLARDAVSAGDIVMSESYFQHAEHYNRIIAANQTQSQQQQQQQRAQEEAAQDGEGQSEDAPGTGPQPAEAPPRDDSGRRNDRGDKSEAKSNGGASKSDKTEDAADVASFDGELPQFLQKPTEESEVAEKPKRARRPSTRTKTAKVSSDDVADASAETASGDGSDEAASDAEAAVG